MEMKSFPVTSLQNQEEWQDLIRAVEDTEMKGAEATENIVAPEKVCHCHYSTATN